MTEISDYKAEHTIYKIIIIKLVILVDEVRGKNYITYRIKKIYHIKIISKAKSIFTFLTGNTILLNISHIVLNFRISPLEFRILSF